MTQLSRRRYKLLRARQQHSVASVADGGLVDLLLLVLDQLSDFLVFKKKIKCKIAVERLFHLFLQDLIWPFTLFCCLLLLFLLFDVLLKFSSVLALLAFFNQLDIVRLVKAVEVEIKSGLNNEFGPRLCFPQILNYRNLCLLYISPLFNQLLLQLKVLQVSSQ